MAAPISLVFRIAANLDEMRANLASGQALIETTASSMKRMANSLDGSSLIANANAMVKVVSDLGGASTLTGAEQKKVNDTLTEAIQKYELLGKEAPQALRDLAQATKAIPDPSSAISSWIEDFGKQAAATAAGFISAQAVIGAVEGAFRSYIELLKGSVTAAAEAESAQRRLTVAVQTQGFAIPTLVSDYRALGDAYQQTTAFSHVAIEGAEALFIQLGNVGPQMMDRALKAATDLSSGIGIDLDSAVTMLSKAFEGHTTGLQRYGIILDSTRVKAEGMDYILGAIEGKVGGQAQAELDTYAGRVKQLGNEWQDLKERLGDFILKDPSVQFAMRETQKALQQTSDATKSGGDGWLDYGKKAFDAVVGFMPGGAVALAIHQAIIDSNTLADNLKTIQAGAPSIAGTVKPDSIFKDIDALGKSAADDQVEEWKKAAEEAKKYADAVQAAFNRISGADATRQMKILDTVFRQLAASGKLTKQELDGMIAEALKLQNQGAELTPRLQAVAETMGAWDPAFTTGIGNLHNLGETVKLTIPWTVVLGQAFDDLNKKTRNGFGGLGELGFKAENGFKPGADKIDAANRVVEESIAELARSFEQLGSAIGGTVGQIVTSMGHMVKAFDDSGKSFATAQKAFAGGHILSGISAAASGISGIASAAIEAGKAVAALWEHFFGTAGRQAIEQFGQSLTGSGDLNALHTYLQNTLGADAEHFWQLLSQGTGRNNPQQAAANIKLVQDAVDKLNSDTQKYNLTPADYSPAKQASQFPSQASGLLNTFNELTGAGFDSSTVTKHMADDFNSLIAEAIQTGQKIPAGLEPILDTLARMNLLTEDNKNALLGLSTVKLDGGTFDDVMAAAGRYGITLDQLGPKLNQLNIDNVGKQLSSDWKTLTSDGEDVNQVMLHMKDQVQGVINNAAKFGDQIPASMRPMIDAMTQAGLLTDGFGHALTDDSTLNWEAPLSDHIDDLIGKISDLIDKLTGPGGVGDALDNVGNRHYAPTINPKVVWPGDGGADGGSEVPTASTGGVVGYGRILHFDRGGFVPQGTDTQPAMLTPGEEILNAAQQKNLAAALRNGGAPQINFHPGSIVVQGQIIMQDDFKDVVVAAYHEAIVEGGRPRSEFNTLVRQAR